MPGVQDKGEDTHVRIPSSLIQNFMTSEFSPKLTSTGEYVIKSPFVDDRKGKLYVNKDTGQWIDFKASGIRTTEKTSGGFLSFVKEYLGFRNNNDAIRYLIDNYNFEYEIAQEDEKKDDASRQILRKIVANDKIRLFGDGDKLGPFGKVAYNYVRNRKLDESYYPKLGYVFNPSSAYHQRVVIPFFENGRFVYFTARSIKKDDFLRYANPSGLSSKDYVFNLDKINEDVIICEGVFDAMSITEDQAATALMSADIGTKQLEKLFDRQVKTIIYVPDQDETGKKKMIGNINKIMKYCPYTGLEIYIYNIPDGFKDLNEMKVATGKNYILKKECVKYDGIARLMNG